MVIASCGNPDKWLGVRHDTTSVPLHTIPDTLEESVVYLSRTSELTVIVIGFI
jgi:hypothetical protein